MNEKKYKYIYGPIPSWRLGNSLGIDPLSVVDKTCTFDCIYCQIGKTKDFSSERKVFIPTEEIIREIKTLPQVKIDYITFSGTGEPTLAKNLGHMIREVKKIRPERIAVLTNSSLLAREDVRQDILPADLVAVKLDADSQRIFELVNRPQEEIKFDITLQAIKDFRKIYTGKLALQVMFTEENKECASQIAQIAREINPDEVQINTPLRPCPAKPLSRQEIDEIKEFFYGLNVVSVYEAEKKEVKPISDEDTLRRRGKV